MEKVCHGDDVYVYQVRGEGGSTPKESEVFTPWESVLLLIYVDSMMMIGYLRPLLAQ